jgi:RNA polymerase sigma factor (sigma-70 family)
VSSDEKDLDDKVEEWIERAAAGDPEATGELFRLYEKRLISVAHSRLGNTLHSLTESVDLVQSVWTDLLGDLEDFEYRGPGSFYGWLRTCLVRKIDQKRRHHGTLKRDSKRARSIEEGVVRGSDPTPSEVVMEGEEVAQLMGLLERFPDPQRRVLVLRLRDEMGFAGIGVEVGRSEGAVKKMYQRGIERLIELLPNSWG